MSPVCFAQFLDRGGQTIAIGRTRGGVYLSDKVYLKNVENFRSVLKTREFKTIVGLVSFIAEMGCTTASIPLKEGGCERHAAPGQLA